MTVTVDPKAIDALFAEYDTSQAPGIVVGVAHQGRPLYRRGFGLASLELPAVLTPTMRLRIGSTTKHFACLAFMLLCEEGKASPDDPVRKHVPELPEVAEGVTVRHLMTHTSGLRGSIDLMFQMAGVGRPSEPGTTFRMMCEATGRNFAPGESWNYNNGGYVILTTIIERLAGQPLEQVLEERILAPVGMNDTLLRRLDTDCRPNSAALHIGLPDGTWLKGVFGPSIAGEGAMASTVDDMLRWLAHMRAPVVGSAETWAEMKRPMVLNNGFETNYGLGLMSGTYRGARVLHHAGGVIGGSSQMLKVVDHDLDIVMMTNRTGPDVYGLTEKVIDACIEGLAPPAGKPGTAVTGTWRSPASGTVFSLVEHEGAQLCDVLGQKLPVVEDDEGWLRPGVVTSSARVRQAGDRLEFQEFGVHETLEPLAPAPDTAPPAPGRYACPEAGAEAVVEVVGGKATLETRSPVGSLRFDLQPIGEGVFSVQAQGFMPLGGLLETDAAGGGFWFSSGRTRRLRFDRVEG